MLKSKEFRIGFIILTSIILAYFGSVYLKNHGLVSSKAKYYSVYNTTDGITLHMQIVINGLLVGQITEITPLDEKYNSFLLTLSLEKSIKIPVNSKLYLQSSFLKNNQLSLELSNQKEYLKENDTIYLDEDGSDRKDIMKNVLNKTGNISDSLKSLISNFSQIMDKSAKKNFSDVMNNLVIVTDHMASISKTVSASQTQFSQSLKNLQILTTTLANQSENLTKIIKNTSEFSNMLISSEIKKTITDLSKASEQLNSITKKIDNKEGSFGLLVNDKKLYEDLDNSSKNLNALLIDIKANPKRYINVSIFGGNKKEKDTTLKK